MTLSPLGKSLKSGIEPSPLPGLITDPNLPDNPIVAVNPAFCRLTLYSAEEVIGRNCRFLAGPATERHLSRRIAESLAAEEPCLVQLINYKKDGTPFLNAVMTAPVYDEEGKLAFFIGSQIEVSEASDDGKSRARARFNLLTPRQKEVARLMAHGLRNKQIANQLALSEKTVKMHRAQLLLRLDARSSAEAVRVVVEAGALGAN